MEIIVVGLDYKKAPISVREKAAFDTNGKKWAWGKHLLDQGHGEVLILSTCNRSEIYLASNQPEEAIEEAVKVYESMYGSEEVNLYLNIWKEREAVLHLYRVAAGFDSLIVGEDQILGQVKQAMEFGMECKHSGKLLNKLFREGITASKRIRHRYGLSETPVSTCYAGIQLLRQAGGGLTGKKVLITGAGNMGALALRHVLSENPTKVWMTNRRHDNLLAFLQEYSQVEPVRYEDRYAVLEEADVLISATASPHTVYAANRVTARQNPLYLLDLAIPRDIDLDIRRREKVVLFDIDDLHQVVDDNMEKRRQIMEGTLNRLEEEVDGYLHWKKASNLDPLLNYVNGRCEDIQRETMDFLEENTNLTPDQLEEIRWVLMGHLKQSFKKPLIQMKKWDDSLGYSDLDDLIEGFQRRQGG